MFGKRKRAEGLLAQSLYEPLDDSDRAELEAVLGELPALQDEAVALRRLVDAFPADEVDYQGDMRAAVIDRLRAQPRSHWYILPHWAVSVAAFVFVAGGVGYWIAMHPPAAVAPSPVASVAQPEGALSVALAEADRHAASREFSHAYSVLAAAVEQHPTDPRAGLAYQRIADLAFDELQWYPEAFAGYDALRHDYIDQFQAAPRNFVRLNLLDETRGPDGAYAGLRALDTARRDGSFDALEDIAARNPATYLASAASGEMAALMAEEGGFDPAANGVRAMRMAQFRARNPVTRTQLRLETAHLLATSPEGRERAREIYEDIANGPLTTLAELARKSLTNIDNPDAVNPQL